MPQRAGQVVADRYELEQELGAGGMGTVWAAHHRVTGKSVALKFLASATASKPEARQRFIREARAASRVRHPNVVGVHDVLELEDGGLVMVMDRLFGQTLGDRLGRGGALSLQDTASLLLPVISAVGTAHAAGVIHRDLKPENIFLTDDPPDVRVLDFGIAKLQEGDGASANLTSTGTLLGTPYYMSPEQIFGERDLDARADVWSIGVILYECLAGARPFEGDNAGQVMKAILRGTPEPLSDRVVGLPRPLEELIERMIEVDRGERLSDLREALNVLAEHAAVTAPAFSAPKLSLPPSARGTTLRTRTRSDPYADTAADPSQPGAMVRSTSRSALLDTADPIEKSTLNERRGGRLLLVAALAGAGLLAAGGWYVMRGPIADSGGAPAPTPAHSAPLASPAPEPSPPKPAAHPSERAEAPQPSASASARAAAPRLRPPAPSPAPSTPSSKDAEPLPHNVEGKVPF